MIDILLATYNGEKFIDTQISSIINQTYTDWKLYIHDDGSTDSTVQKIKLWTECDSRIVYIEDGVTFHNPGMHFMHLLKFSKSELICFSDQDDLWLESKLEIMTKNMEMNSFVPQLIVSNCYLWNSSENSIVPKLDFSCAYNLYEFLFLNGGLQGCAMMFNRPLLNIMLEHEIKFVYMHDHFTSLCAYSFGKVKFIENRLFLYRQHSNNASVHIERNKKEYIKQVMKNYSVPVIYDKSFDGIKIFYEIYKDDLNKNVKEIFQKYLRFDELKPLKRFLTICLSNFSLGHAKHFKLLLKIILRKWRVQ